MPASVPADGEAVQRRIAEELAEIIGAVDRGALPGASSEDRRAAKKARKGLWTLIRDFGSDQIVALEAMDFSGLPPEELTALWLVLDDSSKSPIGRLRAVLELLSESEPN